MPAAADGALEVDAEDDSEDGSSDDDDDESEDGFVDGLDKIQAEGLEPCKMVRPLPSSAAVPAEAAGPALTLTVPFLPFKRRS